MYILGTTNQKAFVIIESGKEIIFTYDYTRANQYEKIGDAMKMAATINHILGKCIISIISGNFD
jgi:hypothetical protein